MRPGSSDLFTTVRSEGGLLPADLLARIAHGDKTLDGLTPETYHLAPGERISESTNRAWNRVCAAWRAFQTARGRLSEGDPGTSVTRERLLLILFEELGYGRLLTAKGLEVDGTQYPISHQWQKTPIHLVGFRVDLDKRTPGVAGAARTSPHGLVQEFLNRSDAHLWGFISNGLTLRVLRDSASLTRQASVEFDLTAMMEGEVYADFVLLWLLCHESRVEAEDPHNCWLERWARTARDQGIRALDRLREGVESAIRSLGSGFLAHPANLSLRERLRGGNLGTQDYYRQVLRLVYRLLFLFVAEDRDLLLDPKADRVARERYSLHYSTGRLRRMAERHRGTRHHDLYRGFSIVMESLGSDAGCPALALPPLGSFLWSDQAIPSLAGCDISNADFLEAARALAFTVEANALRAIDYRNMGTEEMGSVYESLLELHPEIHSETATFELKSASGHERKSTGSYWTHDSLVSCLLDSALDPVILERLADAERLARADWTAVEKEIEADPVKRDYVRLFLTKRANAPRGAPAEALKRAWDSIPPTLRRWQLSEEALLALKVCDSAVGSGHFLVGAGHRLARHLARVRALAQGESEPSPLLYQTALRDVIGHCLYGVDINPMAVELCKVTLWLEAMEPGKPLSFLDHHIRVGNSLLGTTPELIAAGLPDETFTPIEGDDKKACALLKKCNKAERAGLGPLFAQQDAEIQARLQQAAAALEGLPDDRPEDIRAKEMAFHRHEETEEYRQKKRLADAWCAAFVIKKHFREPGHEASASGITQGHLNDLAAGRPLPPHLAADVERLSGQYQFFHWHLAFPEVFAKGGFDCMLGNPPWERVKLQEQEFFASRSDEIAGAPNAAARKKLIANLPESDPALWSAWSDGSREAEGQSHFVRQSGRYPLCGKGDVNTYALFAEHNRAMLGPMGRAGFIVPAGIATDDTTKEYFGGLVESGNLAALYHFENEEKLFPGVHHASRFVLLTLDRSGRTARADLLFFARQISALGEADRHFSLSTADFALLNPNTRTCPTFRSRRDADLNLALYRRAGILWRDGDEGGNPWGLRFMRMLDMANDSGLFRTRAALAASGHRPAGSRFEGPDGALLPLVEAKMVHQFDHRFGTYEGQTDAGENQGKLPELDATAHADPNLAPLPRYWVLAAEVEGRLRDRWDRGWLLGWRDITGTEKQRTVIASLIPRAATGDTFLLMMPTAEPLRVATLYANLSSFALDYAARQKVGGTHLKYHVFKQLPVRPPPSHLEDTPWSRGTLLRDWLLPRILELTYTAWDLSPFAGDVGYQGPPFRWDPARRFLLRCELDAAFFHLYLPAEANGDWRPADAETAEDLAQLKASFPTPRDAVPYIMDTFPIVRRKDEAKFNGDYRTKRVILEIYDAMQESIRTGQPYQTRLDPPPADPRVAHPPQAQRPASGHRRVTPRAAEPPERA